MNITENMRLALIECYIEGRQITHSGTLEAACMRLAWSCNNLVYIIISTIQGED